MSTEHYLYWNDSDKGKSKYLPVALSGSAILIIKMDTYWNWTDILKMLSYILQCAEWTPHDSPLRCCRLVNKIKVKVSHNRPR
jgi:hypothetical protein